MMRYLINFFLIILILAEIGHLCFGFLLLGTVHNVPVDTYRTLVCDLVGILIGIIGVLIIKRKWRKNEAGF